MPAPSRAYLIRRIRAGSWLLWAAARSWFIRVPLRAGLVTRLAVAFCGVAVLTVATSLIAQHGLTAAASSSGADTAPSTADAGSLHAPASGASAAVSAAIAALELATEIRAAQGG
jgi:hypothetical protein